MRRFVGDTWEKVVVHGHVQRTPVNGIDDGDAGSAGRSAIEASGSGRGKCPLRFSVAELGMLHALVLEMEHEGKVSRTFRRLDPQQQTAILDAVLTQATQSGLQGVTMRGVAKALGIAPATLYTYFEGREAMLDFATRVAMRISLLAAADTADVDAAASASETLEQSLWEHIAVDLDYEATHRSIITFYTQAGYRGEARTAAGVPASIVAGMLARIRRRLDAADRRGELREDLDKEVAGRLVNAMLLVMLDARVLGELNDYLQIYGDDGRDEKETLAAAIDIITRGICRTR